MKKILILFVWLLFCFDPQIFAQPGRDIFPHISFFDAYVNYKISPYTPGLPFDKAKALTRVIEVDSLMKALGITHSVSWADSLSTTPGKVNSSRKIFDMHLLWSKDYPELLGAETGKYIKAQGQDAEDYPFEIGGPSIFSIAASNKFGFGTEKNSSIWFNSENPAFRPPWMTAEIIGEDVILPTLHGDQVVKKATPSGSVNPIRKHMVFGVINRLLFSNGFEQHFLSIKAKIDKNSLSDSTPVFKVQLKFAPASYPAGKTDFRTLEFEVKKRDFKGDELEWIELTDPAFHFKEFGHVATNKVIEIAILYEDKITVYIDKIAIHDSLYHAFFGDPKLREKIKNQLQLKIDLVGKNPLFESFFFDEPFFLTARIRRAFTDMVREKMPPGKQFDINGATGNYWAWHLHFDREKSAGLSSPPFRNSVMFNQYPFKMGLPRGNEPGGQDAIQEVLERLIEFRGERILPAGPVDRGQFIGLLGAAEVSHNFTPSLEDDIPLFHTIQVCGARTIINSKPPVYGTGGDDRRTPSAQEISVQANIALSLGAKGFMYYMIPTRIDWGMGTYGVFDDALNPYDEKSEVVSLQRADNPQVPNSRYFALESYITSIKPIEKWILRSHWLNSFSGNSQSYRLQQGERWIKSVYTKKDSLSTEFEDKSYTESGMFNLLRNDDPLSITTDTIFFFITNKRVDESEVNPEASTRFITVQLNSQVLPFESYNLYDISDGIPHEVYKSPQHSFEIKVNGGGGKLIMLIKRE